GLTIVVFTIAGLSFAFGFGNGYAVGIQLGVPVWIAPLVAPAVDLSVVALLASVQFLRANGIEGRLLGPRLLLVFCGLVTLALNTAHPLLAGEYGRACFDAVAPLLLIGWSEVGPGLLASLHGTVPGAPDVLGPSSTVPDEKPPLAADLITQARQLDAAHREHHGRPITRDKLRAALKVSNAVAGELLRTVRTSTEAKTDGKGGGDGPER
ncbi:MAG: hypothetical protein LC775_03100, partial [Acidobacteria bacterium]|nr:hypothetical protein [Acidobacteriota bacterium]